MRCRIVLIIWIGYSNHAELERTLSKWELNEIAHVSSLSPSSSSPRQRPSASSPSSSKITVSMDTEVAFNKLRVDMEEMLEQTTDEFAEALEEQVTSLKKQFRARMTAKVRRQIDKSFNHFQFASQSHLRNRRHLSQAAD